MYGIVRRLQIKFISPVKYIIMVISDFSSSIRIRYVCVFSEQIEIRSAYHMYNLRFVNRHIDFWHIRRRQFRFCG